MHSYSRLIVSALAAALLTGSASSQILGGGGPVGGIVGGLGGGVGNAAGSIGNGVGNTVGGVLGGVGGIGSGSGPLSGVTSGLTNGLNNGLSQTGLIGTGGYPSLDRVSGPIGIATASPMDIENYREARLRALIETNRSEIGRASCRERV